jgi:hypothetical protein
MILEVGDMWVALEETDLFLITANATIKRNGALVMGRGLALEAKRRFPGLDLACGRLVGDRQVYGVGVLPAPFTPLGLFQVKNHFRERADLDLIKRSVRALLSLLEFSRLERVDLNFPGIGNGGLPQSCVLPLIEPLPDRVHVWKMR